MHLHVTETVMTMLSNALPSAGRPIEMSERSAAALAAALLRVALGVMFLAHSVVLKLMTFGLAGTAQFFVGLGLPAWLAYATIFAETIGGVMLVLGIATRYVALALSPILLGAFFVHSGNGWVFTAANGGWEYPAYLFILCIAQALLGDGAFALKPVDLPVRADRS
jgi:putative oxidoreductase